MSDPNSFQTISEEVVQGAQKLLAAAVEVTSATACLDVPQMKRAIKTFQGVLLETADVWGRLAEALPDLPFTPEAN
jgi:hypothetical protein